MNVFKCILVQKVGFLKYKSRLLHGHKMKIVSSLLCIFLQTVVTALSSSSDILHLCFYFRIECRRYKILNKRVATMFRMSSSCKFLCIYVYEVIKHQLNSLMVNGSIDPLRHEHYFKYV